MVRICSHKRTRGLRLEVFVEYLLLGAGGTHIEEFLKDYWLKPAFALNIISGRISSFIDIAELR